MSPPSEPSSSWPEVVIYADGACSGNPGPGGWGAIVRCPARGLETRLSGAEGNATNNRMELAAVIAGLSILKTPCAVTVVTDSRYVVDAFRLGWLANWMRNGWKTADRRPVKNVDLWRELQRAMKPHRVKWEWIRGHANHPENELADELAVAARKTLRP